MYEGYDIKRGWYFWESIVYIRKIALTSFAVMFQLRTHVRSLMGLLVVLIALAAQRFVMPFVTASLNRAESVSLVVCFFTFFLGQFTFVEDGEISSGEVLFIAALVFVMNLGFLVWMVVQIIGDSVILKLPVKMRRALWLTRGNADSSALNPTTGQSSDDCTEHEEGKMADEDDLRFSSPALTQGIDADDVGIELDVITNHTADAASVN
jgi:hypothetical protein